MSAPLENAVAIIGMAGRFPGAGNVEEFWRNLCAGRESVSEMSREELQDGLTPAERSRGRYVASRGLLDEVDKFDAEFFRFLPREAELADPQQRVLLECAWETFEDAGYDPAQVTGNVGVFAGSSINTYLLLHLAASEGFREEFTRSYQVGSFPALVGNGQDFLATRISYKLNLRGPAMTVQSACSTSLLAVAQAWQSLMTAQSDLALAGAVSISFPQRRGYFYQEGGMVSPDGHCRPFDKSAAGTVFGAGAGMVLLKRAEDAVADSDHIYALILGAGVNNDGAGKAGYAAPSSQGQSEAIAAAYAMAGVEPASVSYVECHGTGTPLGDPIEVSALTRVFAGGSTRREPCILSSVKGNVGHLDVAAGMAGIMKAALSLEREQIPGTLHYREPNSHLNLGRTPFRISGDLVNWPRQRGGHRSVRRAGVSAFGVGGTNVHLVLEEAPETVRHEESRRSRQVLTLSARSASALDAQCVRLAVSLESGPAATAPLADVAYTLAMGRRAFRHRAAVVADSRESALAQLRAPGAIRARSIVESQSPRVAMLFPGQGSQYPDMAHDLYRTEPVFRNVVDECCQHLRTAAGVDLLPVLYPKTAKSAADGVRQEAAHTLEQTRFAQPALFVTGYALARLWMQWGVMPRALAGHSVGELTAACLAGVFSLEDALLLVARRGEWMQSMAPGAMLAVRLPVAQVDQRLPAGVSIAAINSPSLTVVSGPHAEIEQLETRFGQEKIAARRLPTSHAFHSPMVEPIIDPLLALLKTMILRAPRIEIVSTVTGKTMTAAEAVSPEYWARQARVPVNFSAAAEALIGEGYEIFMEAGAGDTLTTLLRQHQPRGGKANLFCSLSPWDPTRGAPRKPDWETLAHSIGALWTKGVPVDWNSYYASERRSRVSLPTYPFERKRYWVEPKKPAAETVPHENVDNQENGGFIASQTTMPTAADTAFEDTAMEIQMTPIESTLKMENAHIEADRMSRLRREVAAMLEDLSGLDLTEEQCTTSFLELGFDSLMLTQAAQSLETQFGIKIAFRQLMDGVDSIDRVAELLDRKMPAEVPPARCANAPAADKSRPTNGNLAVPPAILPPDLNSKNGASNEAMMQQLQSMAQWIQSQMQTLGAAAQIPAPSAPVASGVSGGANVAALNAVQNGATSHPAAHHATEMTAEQKRFLDRLVERYVEKTAKSKAFTQQHRQALADPRVASGFRPEWKEMVYSIVSSRSRGSKLWDIDGNEYIDLLNGFGPTMFGHSPEFVTRAVLEQLNEGFAIGPQTPLAGRAAELLTEMTGAERVTFCNTGSEAVMAAMRIARTVTGRDRIVYFSGDYHGQFDEVLAKPWKHKGEIGARPSAPGIPRANLGNIVVLDYGTKEALEYIEQHAGELAAVLVEPMQSRHPELRPKEFLTRLREITLQSKTALVFDEVVTGFRIHPRGAQGYYGIQADLATYGKVVAGGMPIGILAGKAAFMDALDGGAWQYGDASVPEVGVTFFAGTFVRHPLTMAALCATLEHIRGAGQPLYDELNRRADRFAERLKETVASCGDAVHVEHCGSVFFLSVSRDHRFAGLLYYLLREKGIFLLEGFPFYLTTAHSDADLQFVLRAFRESVTEMQKCGLLPHAGVNEPVPLGRSEQSPEIPLTEPQMEVLLAAQVSDKASCAYNESFRIVLDGPLNRAAMESAWQKLIARHDALRMSLIPSGDGMRIHAHAAIPMRWIDLSGITSEDGENKLQALIVEEGLKPFDLVNGPLVRAMVLRFSPERHVLVVTAHHLVCDGWSVNVVVDELGKLYSAAVAGGQANLPPALGFSEYAIESRSPERRAQERLDLEYWKRRLSPVPELLTLPADRTRPSERRFEGETYLTEFSMELAAALRKAGAREGCTLFTTLLAGWRTLLWRLSGNADPVVLVPAAAQAQVQGKVLVAHGVHLLPICEALDPKASAADVMRDLRAVVLDAYEHQTATYGSLIRDLAPAREPGRLPLSEIQFNLERVGRKAGFNGLTAEVFANGKRAVNFDLFLNIVDTGSGLRLECDYSTSLYDELTIARWLDCYRTLLESMISEPNRSIGELALLPRAIQKKLQATNATATGPLPAESVPDLIAQAFRDMPANPAADFYGMEISRAELTERTDRLASWLLRNGAGQGSLVGVYMDRSLEMLVAILGTMKAGAAYVPLDPAFPPARNAQIVEETKVPVMLTLARHLETLPESKAQALALDEAAATLAAEPIVNLPEIGPEDRAYVIFTSGSTGRPKGVELTHRSVVNLLVDLRQRLSMTPVDRLLAVTTLSFDISVLELLLPLVSGGTVLIAHREDVVDGVRLMELLEASRATALQATPVTWRMLLEQGFKPQPGFKMFCGGEAWTTELADRLLADSEESGARLWNMYGPTETTVWSSVTEVKSGAKRMTIGPPMANTRFYVLDERLQPVPPGVSGELFIGGWGVARGYFNRPELTTEKFLKDPFIPSERMYRTGDEVRQVPDGRIEFIGRLDGQVKLRGYRIEMGEIETAMRALPGIGEAVAVLRRDTQGEGVLVGYYTGGSGHGQIEFRQMLRAMLPSYMIPAMLLPIERIPLTPNGKVDRRALPVVECVGDRVEDAFVDAVTPTETVLTEIFRQVLGREKISTGASLLDLGVDSLRMFQIASRAKRRGLDVTVRRLMHLHTIQAVAAALDAESEGAVAYKVSSTPLRRVSRENYRRDF